jgi:hypothetical protein
MVGESDPSRHVPDAALSVQPRADDTRDGDPDDEGGRYHP